VTLSTLIETQIWSRVRWSRFMLRLHQNDAAPAPASQHWSKSSFYRRHTDTDNEEHYLHFDLRADIAGRKQAKIF
jgi:hypothetical protein